MQQHAITLQFHEDFEVFLRHRNTNPSVFTFDRAPSVKDLIESYGVPHPEVRLILANDQPVPFHDKITPDFFYHVFPPKLHPPFPEAQLLPYLPPGDPAFILDVHLGVLARSLRMLGFDSLYQKEDPGDAAIAAIAGEQQRIALSRDIGLLKRSTVTFGHWVRARQPAKQLREVVIHYSLAGKIKPFTRCMNCNRLLVAVAKEDILNYLPERVREAYNEFVFCSACDQCFWKGSHYHQMQEIIRGLR